MPEQQQEEKKLGPNATYKAQGGAKLVTVYGVMFKDGESVNLEEKLGPERSKDALKKLSGNRYFQVDGGPDHEKEQQRQDELPDPEVIKSAQAKEAELRAAGKDDEADQFVQGLDEQGRPKEEEPKNPPKGKQGEPPEDVKMPERETLERSPQRPPLRK